jgi:hypothetical protein
MTAEHLDSVTVVGVALRLVWRIARGVHPPRLAWSPIVVRGPPCRLYSLKHRASAVVSTIGPIPGSRWNYRRVRVERASREGFLWFAPLAAYSPYPWTVAARKQSHHSARVYHWTKRWARLTFHFDFGQRISRVAFSLFQKRATSYFRRGGHRATRSLSKFWSGPWHPP